MVMKDSSGRGDTKNAYGSRIGYGIFHLLIRITGPIPAYILLAFILPYYLLIRTSARKSVNYYLRHRFPDQGKIRHFLSATYYLYQFGKVLIDQAAMGILDRECFHVEFPGQENLYNLAQKRKGMVLLTTHAGNWQTAMATMDHIGTRVNLLFNIANDEGRHFFDLAGHRERFHFIAPTGFLGGMVEATNALRAGEIVAIMGDRAWGAKTIEIEFLGEKAAFPITPYYLTAVTGADLVVSLTVRTGRMSFTIGADHISGDRDWTQVPRDEAVKTLMQRYVSCLETYLEKNPYMWFNFFDFWGTNNKGTV